MLNSQHLAPGLTAASSEVTQTPSPQLDFSAAASLWSKCTLITVSPSRYVLLFSLLSWGTIFPFPFSTSSSSTTSLGAGLLGPLSSSGHHFSLWHCLHSHWRPSFYLQLKLQPTWHLCFGISESLSAQSAKAAVLPFKTCFFSQSWHRHAPHYTNLWSSLSPPSLSSSPSPHPDYSNNKVCLQIVPFSPSPLPLLWFKLLGSWQGSFSHIASSEPLCILPP